MSPRRSKPAHPAPGKPRLPGPTRAAWLFVLAGGAALVSPAASPRAAERLPRSWAAPEAAAAVRAPHGMVASASGLASEAGAEILRKGGNAVDAAVATALALAVTYPVAGNLGGGGFMLVRMADGRTLAIDFREAAPGLARREMYVGARGELIPRASTEGYQAVGVPGTVAGLSLALQRLGTLSWRKVVAPAQRLAADGFPVSAALATSLRGARELLGRFPESRRIFLRDGNLYAAGDVLRQPELAATLSRLAEDGPGEFYHGRTAELLARDEEANGGLLRRGDLEKYRAVVREPLRGRYRGCELVTMPPPSSGGIALIEMLNVLERFDVRRLGHNTPDGCHLLIECMRRAFADRSHFPGDPDFVRVPVAGLTSPAYAALLAGSIDMARATPSEQVSHGQPAAPESPQTTHFSVVDRSGNVVACTYTLNMAYGSGVTPAGLGFLLNNEMDDFTSKPGAPNGFGLIQGEANAIAPGKRPLSSMTPTIVLRDGKFWFAVGSPGGPTIINTVLQVVVDVVDHGMDLPAAVGAARIHHQWQPDVVRREPGGLSPDVEAQLRSRGHVLSDRPAHLGDVQAVMVDPATGERVGASDPRSPDGRAVGH